MKNIPAFIHAKYLLLVVAFVFWLGISSVLIHVSYAQSADDAKKLEEEIQKLKEQDKEKESELSSVQKKAESITNSIKKLSGQVSVTQSEITELQNAIKALEVDIDNLNKKLFIKNTDLSDRRKIRDLTLRNLYITNQKPTAMLLLGERSVSAIAQNHAYYAQFFNDSKNIIGSISSKISSYESDKKSVEDLKTKTEKQKQDMQALVAKLKSQVAGSQQELAQVSQKQQALSQERNEIQKKLSELSAKQKSILGEKTETFTTSVGDVPATGDPNSRADFNPPFRSAFAAFSFGAPHRKGMSQYGAKGRAEDGQKYDQILKAYYGDIDITSADVPSKINTTSGTMDLDGKYLKGLAEMPSTWPMEAMKAQAIAARTYALSYVGWRTSNTDPSGKICTTENCQVWSSSKATSGAAARWHQAVDETKGKIMKSKKSGEIFAAWYAASSGGYNYTYTSLGHPTKGGWDTSCGSKDCWTSQAFESKAGSPWFYKGWYKTRDNKTCGRTHPWLTEEEFADIVGAAVLYQKDSDNQTHLSQPDAQKCWGESIDGTWSRADVKEKSGVSSVDSVSVSYSSGGVTSSVKIKTNKGEHTFSGEDFKAIFNLRAPGAIHLTSLLFNVEMKK